LQRQTSPTNGETVLAPDAVGGQQDFSVRLRAEDLSERFQVFAESLEVIDLTVEGDDKSTVIRGERLVGLGREVDDRKSPVTEADASVTRLP
jgi:hypothetical protein